MTSRLTQLLRAWFSEPKGVRTLQTRDELYRRHMTLLEQPMRHGEGILLVGS